MNFLFWNIKKKNSDEFYSRLIQLLLQKDTDILMLAELPEDDINGCEQFISTHTNGRYRRVKCLVFNKVVVFATTDTDIYSFDETGKRIGAFKIKSRRLDKDILLFPIHFYDKYSTDCDEQDEKMNRIRTFIEKVEDRNGEKEFSIVCGDFNLNPFEKPMIKTRGMHAVMDRKIALKGDRTVEGNKYTFFYNPMWGFFGDAGKGNAPGTFYRQNSGNHISMFWHLYDQLLVRKGLIEHLDTDKLDIVTQINNQSLLKDSVGIDSETFSDHLPIVFSLNI